ncbi:MAG: hypothetical protein P4L85_18005 [Paludisphaera borealis]|uniref:hypothetical protein n=1 Tax=Paludisphaera borealis TaxID=1387353 RepID=UPI002846B244|nr:hypothetical protein [Paludisphaera borealis]MDR3621251.1 hypothetical protein [Paludisphaera borealis]
MGSPFDEAFGLGGMSWEDDSALADALEPGEKVVWTGRPTTGTLVRRSLGKALFWGMGYGAPALFILFCFGTGKDWRDARRIFADHTMLTVLPAISATAASLAGLLCVLAATFRARRTLYALTDRRALIFEFWLFGGRRPDVFTPEILDLMQCKERGDGSGDLIFEVRGTLNWPSRSVGFLGVDRVREVEELLRRTLSPDDRGSTAQLKNATGVWRLRIFTRYYIGLFFSFFLLWAASWLVVGPVLLAMLAYRLVTGRIPLDRLAFVGVVVGVPLCALAVVGLLALHKHWFVQPFEIEINDDRTVTFRNWFRTRVVPVADVLSIRSGGWMDPNSNGAVVRHKQGAVSILNDFPNFRDFVSKLKALNPSIDVRMF